MYRFHVNVERQLNAKLHDPNSTPILWVDPPPLPPPPTFEWRGNAMAFHKFIFISFFRTDGKKGDLDENNFRHYGDFFEDAILEVTWSGYVQSSLSAVAKHIHNSILKDTIQLKIFQFHENPSLYHENPILYMHQHGWYFSYF